jgi:spore coat protein U-like protein
MKKSLIQRGLVAGMVIASLAPAVQAETASSSFQVGVDVRATCSISAADMTFDGITTGTTSRNDAETNLSVNCSSGAPYEVALSNGDNFSGGRRLGSNGSFINYSLFKDNSRSAEWSIASPVLGTGNGANQIIPVFGRIPAGQSVPNMGSYADTIVATVSY